MFLDGFKSFGDSEDAAQICAKHLGEKMQREATLRNYFPGKFSDSHGLCISMAFLGWVSSESLGDRLRDLEFSERLFQQPVTQFLTRRMNRTFLASPVVRCWKLLPSEFAETASEQSNVIWTKSTSR